MVRYIVLLNFTEQGIANVQDSPDRAAALKKAAAKKKVKMEAIYWTLGSYDAVGILSAPDEATAVALALELGKAGNVRSTMLRAFDAAEFKEILSKVS